MAETSGPFDGSSLVEADWDLMMETLVDGVHGVPGSSLLNASISGSTLRGVDFAAGTASCRGHWYRNSATLTKASGTNLTGSPRIDRAALQLDRTANTVTIAVVPGTAGSGQPPTLADTSTLTQRPLYKWTVGASATAVTDLTDERQWRGTTIKPCTSTNRPYLPAEGDLASEIDTGRTIRFDGTAWNVLTQDSGLSALTLASGFVQGGITLDMALINGIAYLTGSCMNPSSISTEKRIANIPSACQPRKSAEILVYQDGGTLLLARAYASGTRSGQLWLIGNLANANGGVTIRMSTSWPA